MKSYTEDRELLEDLPDTWCPGLLFVLVKTCVRKKVFQPGELEGIVKRAQEEENEAQKKDLTPTTP